MVKRETVALAKIVRMNVKGFSDYKYLEKGI